jgi:hypothetical protein
MSNNARWVARAIAFAIALRIAAAPLYVCGSFLHYVFVTV